MFVVFEYVCYNAHMASINQKTEIKMLRSLAISIVGQDREGSYKPAFVRRVLSVSMRKPTRTFTTPKKFLDDVKKHA